MHYKIILKNKTRCAPYVTQINCAVGKIHNDLIKLYQKYFKTQ